MTESLADRLYAFLAEGHNAEELLHFIEEEIRRSHDQETVS